MLKEPVFDKEEKMKNDYRINQNVSVGWRETYDGIEIVSCVGATAELTLPDTIDGRKVVAIGDGAFCANTTLTRVTLPQYATRIEAESFKDCANLRAVVMPKGLKTIGYQAFAGCVNLASPSFPPGLEYLATDAFRGCARIRTVILPGSLRAIGACAFEGCIKLRFVMICSRETSIGNRAFENCRNLHIVRFSADPRTVGDWAFAGCDKLCDRRLKKLDARRFRFCAASTTSFAVCDDAFA